MEQTTTSPTALRQASLFMSIVCQSHGQRNLIFSADEDVHHDIARAITQKDRETLEAYAFDYAHSDLRITTLSSVIDLIIIG